MAESTLGPPSRGSVKVSFAWYDLWVGVFVDRAKRTIYVCPLPCVLITIRRKPQPAPPAAPHAYRPHRYVKGVCRCGWPPDDERHVFSEPVTLSKDAP